MKYIDKIADKMYSKITSMLPHKFGGVMDGWSDGCGNHYIGFFATFMIGQVHHKLLLSVAPLLDETNQTAQNQVDFIKKTLEWYKAPITALTFLVGDNTGVNPSIARILKIPFVGCFSHLFNLALQEVISSKYDEIVEKIKDDVIHVRYIFIKQ